MVIWLIKNNLKLIYLLLNIVLKYKLNLFFYLLDYITLL